MAPTTTPKVFRSAESWIEGEAERQLEQTAGLPGISQIVGMPDLTPSKNCAVGTVAFSETRVYPHLVGNDMGCGYSLFQTDIPADANAEKLSRKITGLDDEWDGDAATLFHQCGVLSRHFTGIGTVGGGNHFCELQAIDEVMDADALRAAKIDQSRLVLLVHSGSRSFGEAIYREWSALCGSAGLAAGSPEAEAYLDAHDDAVRWAIINRAVIAKRLLACLDTHGAKRLDLPHNFISRTRAGFLHRKGAAPADCGLSPLPGSRGAHSYLMQPLMATEGLSSLAHGAGRRYSRANMHGRVTETTKQMVTSKLGSIVVCGDELLLREEHETAYKDIAQVVKDLVIHNLAQPAAKLRPVITYKSERDRANLERKPKRDKEESWRRERREKNRR